VHWRENWFYLPNLVLVLRSIMEEWPGGATPESWRLFPPAEEVMDVPAPIGDAEALRV
jgi:hypothetical protein